jgi:urease accessory protein
MTGTDLLTLTQWLSPAFPVGSYAYSHGLEAVIAAGEVSGPDSLAVWLDDTLRLGAGRADAILLAAAHRGEDAAALAAVARALAASAERWHETMAQGRAFAEAVNAVTGSTADAMPYPVAVGVAARRLALDTGQVAALYLHAFAANLVSAAVRFVPLGQAAGQRVLAGLHPAIADVAAEATVAQVDDIATSVLRGDLAAMRHETMDVRIFKT